jgi:flagellar assembly protein FliH
MGIARKYAFDTEFAPDGAIVRTSTTRLTPEAVEVERNAAYERGKQDAMAQAEREAAIALQGLAATAAQILKRLDAETRAHRDDGAVLALAVAHKVAGAALSAYGDERALKAIEGAMDMLRQQPKLVVRLPKDAANLLKPRIDAMAEAHGYAGAILVREDETLVSGAVSIDWSDGVVVHDPVEIARRVDSLIHTTLSDPVESQT